MFEMLHQQPCSNLMVSEDPSHEGHQEEGHMRAEWNIDLCMD